MPTVTRQQIKAVENRMRRRVAGLRSHNLGQLPIPLPSGADLNLKAIWEWISGYQGQLKIQATTFAENAVKMMYGTEPNCGMPPSGIPVVPLADPPKFCAASVAGQIERCRLSDASNSLSMIKSKFTSEMSSGSEIAPYVKRWYDEYGRNDFTNLEMLINNSKAACSGGGTITPVPVGGNCPPGYKYNATMERCDYVLPGVQTGISSNTLLALGGFAILALFLMKR